MRFPPTKGTDFMQALIEKGNSKTARSAGNGHTARKRFGNVDIDTNTSKFAFKAKQGILVNSNHRTNRF